MENTSQQTVNELSLEQFQKHLSEEQLLKQEEMQKLLSRIVVVKSMLDANKPLYEELESLTLAVNVMAGQGSFHVQMNPADAMYLHGGEVKHLSPNQIVTIVDNFAGKNTIFRTAAAKRFEASIESLEEQQLRNANVEKKSKKK